MSCDNGTNACKHGIASLVRLDREIVTLAETVVEPAARFERGGELLRQRLIEAEAEPELRYQLAECASVDVVQELRRGLATGLCTSEVHSRHHFPAKMNERRIWWSGDRSLGGADWPTTAQHREAVFKPLSSFFF